MLPAICQLSLRQTQKIVLNIQNYSIYAGTTACTSALHPRAADAIDKNQRVIFGMPNQVLEFSCHNREQLSLALGVLIIDSDSLNMSAVRLGLMQPAGLLTGQLLTRIPSRP